MKAEAICIRPARNSDRRIEFFVSRPAVEAPWPAIVNVHGHQHPERPGGRKMAESGCLDELATAGCLAIAISQPGYGGSDGPPDYCGPRTQHAILAVIAHAIEELEADESRIALVGASRGAIASSVAATQTDRLAALMLSAGCYDFEACYRECPWSGIRENIEREAGTSREAFAERSALDKANKIRCPVLVMHGGQDDRFSPKHAERFAAALEHHHVPVERRIFPEEPHVIGRDLFLKTTHAFLNRHLGTTLPTSDQKD